MVIPVGDVNPAHRRPFVTWVLLAVNIGVFLFFQPWADGACEQQRFFLEWATVPLELQQGEPLDAEQVRGTTPDACQITPVQDKDVYAALLYSMFLHAGWLHLLGNMLYLWIFGNNVEDKLGHLGFLLFYLVTGAIATIAFVVPNLTSPITLVGASGAIAGVLGAYLVLFPTARITVLVPFLLFLPLRLPALLVLGMWFLLQIEGVRVGQMSGVNVAYLAHAAGFVAGVGLVLLLGFRPQPRPHGETRRARRRARQVRGGW